MGTSTKNCTMNSLLLSLLVIASLWFSSGAASGLSSLEVQLFNGKKCSFNRWENHGIKPAYPSSCTRNYYTYDFFYSGLNNLVNGYYPFCYWGSSMLDWDYCYKYTWDFEFKNEDGTTTKKSYYYNYYNTNTPYYSAVTACKKIGYGWDIASFNSTFNFANGKLVFHDKLYKRSEKNIQDAIAPLGQTFDVFWVKNENSNYNGCLRYDREQTRNHGPRGKNVDTLDCFVGKSFVCERNH